MSGEYLDVFGDVAELQWIDEQLKFNNWSRVT